VSDIEFTDAKRENVISHARLTEVLHYASDTGNWIWLVRLTNRTKVGARAGTERTDRRRQIRIDGVCYLESRLAWFYMTGKWPPVMVDHKDTDPSNGRWSNLRLATNMQNKWNDGATKRSSTGLKGVFPSRSKFSARIMADGKDYYLGTHDTPEEAAAAYAAKAHELHGEFARTK
jgi:hypothetical protein